MLLGCQKGFFARSPRQATWATLLLVGCGAATGGRGEGVSAGAASLAGGGAGPGQRRSSLAVTSNVLRQDYVGSAVCEPCHSQIYAAWSRSPMHEMTRIPEQARIRAPFDGTEFRFKDDRARFEQVGAARVVRVTSAELGTHVYQVTKVIGGRYREDYAGVEVGDQPASRGASPAAARAELILPVSFVFETHSYRLKGYSVMVGERPGLRVNAVWNQTCVLCHNTNPYFDSVWGALYGSDARGYQGEVVDRLLPPERQFLFEVTDQAGLVQALEAELAFLGERPPPDGARAADGRADRARQLLDASMRALRRDLTPAHFVELGIGCESCHGGSREHLKSDRVLPDFEPRSRFWRARPASGRLETTRAEMINRACARCHQVLFSRYPFTWEGGTRHGNTPAGGSSIASGEARDFLMGGCARQMACTACHDPHAEDAKEKMRRLESVAGNAVCTGCHARYAEPEGLRRHAHHDPGGAGGACLACHMPRKNMGLGYALTPYHRIGSPTDADRVERDRPLECALCHADRSVGGLVADMERLWGKRYDRGALARLYGDLGANALLATVERGKAHEQVPAMVVLGQNRVRAALPSIARWLTHPIPLVRYYAKRAVDAIRGAPCDVDLDRTTPEIAVAARRCVPGGGVPAADATAAPGVGALAPADAADDD